MAKMESKKQLSLHTRPELSDGLHFSRCLFFFLSPTAWPGDLSSLIRDQTRAEKAWSPNHWITREFPSHCLFLFNFYLLYLFTYFIFWLHWVFVAVCGLLIEVASLVVEHRL